MTSIRRTTVVAALLAVTVVILWRLDRADSRDVPRSVPGPPAAGGTETWRLAVIADNSIVSVDSERDVNMGAARALRVKSTQHHLILKFDTAPLAGRTVTAARLRYARQARALDRVTISTIQGDWAEGASTGFAESVGGATYNHALHPGEAEPGRSWAWPGSRFPDVAYGNAYALFAESDSPEVNGYYSWELPPDVVHANAVGASYGLAVSESGPIDRNPTVRAREARGRLPFLEVELGPPVAPPAPVEGLRTRDDLAERGEIVLEFVTPARAFAYDVEIDGTPAPRYLIPFAGPEGSVQTIRLRDRLEPGQAASVQVRAVSRSGSRSAATRVRGVASTRSALPLPRWTPPRPAAGGGPIEAPGLRIWAAPETDKIQGDGTFLDEVPEGYAAANGRFAQRAIRLRAARNEVVSFQLVLESTGPPVRSLRVSLEPAAGLSASLQRVDSVRTSAGPMPEVLTGGAWSAAPTLIAATDGDPGSRGGRVRLLLGQVAVPARAQPGRHDGIVRIRGGYRGPDGRTSPIDVDIPLELDVRRFTLPDQPRFHLELNTYGYPTFLATYRATQRVAHRYRTYVNYLPYNQSGRARLDMTRSDGSSMSEVAYNRFEPGDRAGHWEPDFSDAFGPFFSGEAFAAEGAGPWPGVPVPAFYLTFHENWPLAMRDYYRAPELDAFAAFPPVFGQTWTAVLRDFCRHAASRDWSRTMFQVYLNNKPGPGRPTAWHLDEPASHWDFRALDYFASLAEAAEIGGCPARVVFRADISRPQYHRGYLDRIDLFVCSQACFEFPRLIRALQRRNGFELWTYGSPSRVTESNHHVQAWAARTYALGGLGLTPWRGLRTGRPYLSGVDDDDQRFGLIIVGDDAQRPSVRATLRLAAYLRAQQDMEYLRLLEEAAGYTRTQVAGLVARYLGPALAGPATPRAAAALTEAVFDDLREHAAAAIEETMAIDDGQPVGQSRARPDGGAPPAGGSERLRLAP